VTERGAIGAIGAFDRADGLGGVDRLLARARDAIAPRPGPADLAAVWAEGGLVVDIRPVGLRDRDGVLPGALVVDRNVLEWRLDPAGEWRLPEVTGPHQKVVLFCDEGYASSLAAATLREVGLRRATDLDGGYQAWLRFRNDAVGRADGWSRRLT
jgi:rhodanese-related sulfurtransferase